MSLFPSGSTLNTDLVAGYRLNEKSGTVAYDHGINGLHGTNTGATVKQPGVFDTCYEFESTDNVQIPNNSLLTPSSGFTFSVLVNITNLGGSDWPAVFGKEGEYLLWMYADGRLNFNLYENGGTNYIQRKASVDFTGNKWIRVTITWNGGVDKTDISIFYDAVDVSGDTGGNISSLSTGLVNTSNVLYFARSYGGNWLAGSISDFFIWDRALTTDEINELVHPYLPSSSFPSGSSLSTGVIAHYKNWNNKINKLVDYSGNGHHGEIDGASYVAGVNKYGLEFESANSDYAELPNNSELDWGDQLTIFVRVKISSTQWHTLLSNEVVHGSERNQFSVGNTRNVYFKETSTVSAIASADWLLNLDTWYNIVIVKDGTSRKIYVDSSEVASDSSGVTPDVVGSNYTIGAFISNNNRDYLNGIIDELIVWNKAVSIAEITELQKPYKIFDYASTLNDNLALSMDFEEMEGTAVFDGSGNGLHGVNSGAEILQDGSYGDEKAYSFDGDNDQITMDSPIVQEGDISICFVVNPLSLANWSFILGDYTTSNYGWDVGLMADGSLVCAFRNGSHADGFINSVFTVDTWVRVIIIQDSSDGIVYVYKNGVLAGTLTNQLIFELNGNEEAEIGSRNDNNYSNILIDKVFAWSKKLSSSEITELDNFLQGVIDTGIEINLDHLQTEVSLFEPTAKLVINNNLDFLNVGASLFEPIVKRVITQQLDQLNAGLQIYDPSVKLIISQVLEQLNLGAQLHEISAKRTIAQALEVLTVGAQIYDVSVKNIISIALEYLLSGTSLYEPETKLSIQTDLENLQASASLHEPDVKRIISQSLDLLQVGVQLHDLEMTGAMIVILDHLAAGVTMVEPETKLSIQTDLEALQAGAQLQEPEVKRVIYQVLDFLQAGGQIYDAQAKRVIKTTLTYLNAGAALSDLSIKLTLKAELEKLEAGAAIYEPVIKRIITETLDHLIGGAQAYDIQAIRSMIVSLDHLIAGASMVDPTIKLTIKEELDHLQAGMEMLDPVVKLKMITEIEALLMGAQLHDIELMIQAWEIITRNLHLTTVIEKSLPLTAVIEKEFKFH